MGQDEDVAGADGRRGEPGAGREETPSGVLTKVSPHVRRIVAPNPSAFTFTGTCTYIVGEGEVAIVDPGPDDDDHLARLVGAVSGERVAYIVVTHTHRDHSALAPRLAAAVGAPIVGAQAHVARPGPPAGLDAAHDASYAPDTVLADGEAVRFGGLALTAVATPGHSANHLAFALEAENALFSGDHVMAWSTTVVAPPDGSMSDYMASLEKLRGRGEEIYWPGHGGRCGTRAGTCARCWAIGASARRRFSRASRPGRRRFPRSSSKSMSASIPGSSAPPGSPRSPTSRT